MIKYPKTFSESVPANFDGLFDWDFLLSAFEGTKIEPMDIDAIIERLGNVLIFETKLPDKEIPLGQEITFKTLLKLGQGKIFVFVLYGKSPDSIVAMDEWFLTNGQVAKRGIISCDSNYVLERVSAWFKWANKKARSSDGYKGQD